MVPLLPILSLVSLVLVSGTRALFIPIPIPVPSFGVASVPVVSRYQTVLNPVQIGQFQDPNQFRQGQFVAGVPINSRDAQFNQQWPNTQQHTRLRISIPVASGQQQQTFQQYSRTQNMNGGAETNAQISLRAPTQVLLPANIRIVPSRVNQLNEAANQPQRTASWSPSSQFRSQQLLQPQPQQNQNPVAMERVCGPGVTLEDVQIKNIPCVPVLGVSRESDARRGGFGGSLQSQDATAQQSLFSDQSQAGQAQDSLQNGVASGDRTLQVRVRIPLPDDEQSDANIQLQNGMERSAMDTNAADNSEQSGSFSAVLKRR